MTRAEYAAVFEVGETPIERALKETCEREADPVIATLDSRIVRLRDRGLHGAADDLTRARDQVARVMSRITSAK